MKSLVFTLSIISILIISGCIGQISDKPLDTSEFSFTQTIKYTNENMTVFIKRNTLNKTAFIEINTIGNSSQFEKNKDLAKFAVSFACSKMIEFFNIENKNIENENIKLDNMNRTLIGDFSQSEITLLEKTPLSGYEIKKVQFATFDIKTSEKLAECTIIGPSKEDVAIKIY